VVLPRNLDVDLLRAFAAIAAEQNISRAAERLLRNQSTVSLQLKRLEELVGQRLFERTPRRVSLTHDGEVLLGYANRMLALNDEVMDRINEPRLEGTVRLGVPEDFATTHMPAILGAFARTHPLVALEVTCDLTLNLMARFRQGAFDIVLVKREPAARMTGVRVWREPLVWVGAEGYALPESRTVPLVVSPEPCVYRKRAIGSLRRAKVKWRVAYQCGSLAGNLAAVKAGLGVSVLPKDMVPRDLHIMGTGGLPELRDTEIALMASSNLARPSQRLREHIIASLEKPARPAR
jgi:DNA-binding transcriptional LysR family regulator